MTAINIRLSGLHPAQQAVHDHPARYKVLRCGRRYGKTQLAVYLAVLSSIRRGKVGWFAPETQYAREAWERLEETLGAAVMSANMTTRVIRVAGGGSVEVWSLHDNPDAGRSRAYDLVVVDEAGLCPTIDQVWDQAIGPTLIDRVGVGYILGTSKQHGIGFRRLARRATGDPQWALFRGRTLDNPFLPQPTTSQSIEAARLHLSPARWAAEYEGGDDDDSGTFFPAELVERLASVAPEPMYRLNVDLPITMAYDRDHWIGSSARKLSAVSARSDAAGAWRMWVPLVDDRGVRRPSQASAYVFGVDVGTGVGASNTVISVVDADMGRKVAVYRASRVTPPEAARIAAIAGLWFGGRYGCAMVNYEANGPGESFGQSLAQVGYQSIARRTEFGSRVAEDTKPAYGWWSTTKSKEQLLIAYRESLTSGEFFNPSSEGLRECLPYRYDEHGRVVTDVQADGTHGDEVIADALACAACRTVPKPQPGTVIPPPGSDAWMEMREERIRETRDLFANADSRWI